jgi:hypothetical protein
MISMGCYGIGSAYLIFSMLVLLDPEYREMTTQSLTTAMVFFIAGKVFE